MDVREEDALDVVSAEDVQVREVAVVDVVVRDVGALARLRVDPSASRAAYAYIRELS